jgi:flagellar assembly protein FliH
MERVLKARDGRAWTGRRIAGEAWQAGQEARAIVAAAQAEVAALRREAEEEAAATRAAAVAEGFAAGRGEGLADAAATLVRAATVRERWLAEARGEALDLALEVARRLLGRELAADPAAVRGAAAEALAAARGRRRLVLRLHPAGAAALAGEGTGLAALAGVPSVAIESDPSLQPGDVVVETEAGGVDGRVAARLSAFRAALEAAP